MATINGVAPGEELLQGRHLVAAPGDGQHQAEPGDDDEHIHGDVSVGQSQMVHQMRSVVAVRRLEVGVADHHEQGGYGPQAVNEGEVRLQQRRRFRRFFWQDEGGQRSSPDRPAIPTALVAILLET